MLEIGVVFLITAAIMIMIAKFLGWALSPFIGNIIAGGVVYWLIDALGLVALPWSVLDAIIVAFFGVPGTIVIAICRAIF